MANVAKDFAQLISQSKSNKTGPYDTQATVKRVEGNTVWVSIPGGVDETPIDKTVNCTAGDKVQVRVSGGRAWITGNASSPPTDDKTANEAKTKAVVAEATAIGAKETADAVEGIATSASATAVTAKTIAEGVNEHFWHDSTGAHVTEVTQEEWNEPTDPNYHSGGNTLITTQGMAIRNGLTNLAEFGATGATIGVSGSQIAHLGYGPGTDSGGGTSDAPYYTLGVRTGTVGNYSTAEGNGTEASRFASHAEGGGTTASGGCSHAEGYETTASGAESHAEGYNTTASGGWSHAEGQLAVASDEGAHAEGLRTTASGVNAHAEGSVTTASGFDAHAQNGGTVASGDYSHAGGLSTTAGYDSQTTVGRYNDNQSTTAFEIGNGTADNARSNALAVDWSGNVEAAGSITAEGHDSPIGYRAGNNSGTWSVPNSSETNVPSANLTPLTLTPGVWIVFAQAEFSSNATGRRFIEITTSISGNIGRSAVSQNAVSGGSTRMLTTTYLSLTTTQDVTIRVYQNSGAARSADFNLAAVRIA